MPKWTLQDIIDHTNAEGTFLVDGDCVEGPLRLCCQEDPSACPIICVGEDPERPAKKPCGCNDTAETKKE